MRKIRNYLSKFKFSIIYISYNQYPGQGSTALFEYSRKIRLIGNKVYVIAIGRENEKDCERIDGVHVIRIKIKKKGVLNLLKFIIFTSIIIRRIFKFERIDIVHVFSHPLLSLIRLFLSFTRGETRSIWLYDIRSGPLGFGLLPLYQLLVWLIRIEALFFDGILTINEYVKNEILGEKFIKNVFISPLGVDLNLFKPNKKDYKLLRNLRIKKDDIVLLYVGSLSPFRKIENLIYAFYIAYAKIKNLKFVIIGDGESKKSLYLLVKRLSLSNKIIFIGYVDYRKIPNFLSLADIAISYVPKTYCYDPQPPLKVIEYLACSLPVIATNTRGHRIIIEHRKNGWLTNDDPSSIARSIIKLCVDSKIRKKIAKKARNSVEKYDWNKIIKKYLLPIYLGYIICEKGKKIHWN